MRARRPEQFSDSREEPVSELDRSLLEYHLDTLTNRNQELDFERFARLLCEREVCPNLLPHTGPAGGGDSKVDTESYPVADALTFVWFVGIGRIAAQERWAFAFSAKADWRDKVKDDIAKIAATGRGYRQAFFVTSRFVPDRARAEVEDSLRQRHQLEVHIFDRAWILDRVFGQHHEELAIAELKVTGLKKSRVIQGPQDLVAERERAAIEEAIKTAVATSALGHDFVDDCIEAARLARAVDRPREEIEGCFLRARQAAEEHGSNHQQLRAKYQEAWTAYWWFEDYPKFASLYGEVEKHVFGTVNPRELELLTNLWMILFPLCQTGALAPAAADLGERTRRLKAELERLGAERDRSSAALQARTFRLNVELAVAAGAQDFEQVDTILGRLEGVVRESEGLVGYPLEPLVQIFSELGPHLGDRPPYDRLFETVVEMASRREGDATAAQLLCKRGADQLEARNYYDAIRLFGRALGRLFQHETREELVKALYLCAHAYSKVGLLWASRGTLLTAASVATNEFHMFEEVTFAQGACYFEMKVVELELGRIPHMLAWRELERAVLPILEQRGQNVKRMTESSEILDGMLGILMLKAELWQLKRLTRLPMVLRRLDLPHAAIALRFALGDEEEVAKEFSFAAEERGKVVEFFEKWRDQPGAHQIPARPELCDGTHVKMNSRILGCDVRLRCENRRPCVELAESVLAALESLLATGLAERLISKEPHLTFEVRRTDFVPPPFDFELSEPEGQPHVEVRCAAFNPHAVARDAQVAAKEKLISLLAVVLARVFLHGDPEPMLQKLFRDERALERAVGFTSSFVTVGNILGHEPKTTLEQWIQPNDPEFPLRRALEWDAETRNKTPAVTATPSELEFGHGELPETVTPESIKQSEIATFSLFRESLWNRARWMGAAFVWELNQPPFFCLAFRDEKAATEIFTHWRRELGRFDEAEKLRISVLQKIARQNPHAYRIVLSPTPRVLSGMPDVKQFAFVSRCTTAEPDSDHNLTNFLAAYRRHGGYLLAPAILKGDAGVEPLFNHGILKRELHVREAWQVGRHDPDSTGIRSNDDPFIPTGETGAPVLELLQFLRSE